MKNCVVKPENSLWINSILLTSVKWYYRGIAEKAMETQMTPRFSISKVEYFSKTVL